VAINITINKMGLKSVNILFSYIYGHVFQSERSLGGGGSIYEYVHCY
jgi:hypothetical protein